MAEDPMAANQDKAGTEPPPMRVLIRTKEEGSFVRPFPLDDGDSPLFELPVLRSDYAIYSKNGAMMASVETDTTACVRDAITGKVAGAE
mmetsp:Transcript_8541/g.25678  ORF Transcript_8541/g.25678 Transcript_8541/m.25678 type:complete len:89 (-) Transcript_8541:2156-2422(-)